jgi:hypothetical protein
MGLPLRTVRQVCEFLLQSMEARPVPLLLRALVASGNEIMQFAELHVFLQCR